MEICLESHDPLSVFLHASSVLGWIYLLPVGKFVSGVSRYNILSVSVHQYVDITRICSQLCLQHSVCVANVCELEHFREVSSRTRLSETYFGSNDPRLIDLKHED